MDVEYPRIKEDLAEARAQGDTSDNAGYREARRLQAKAISRIKFLQKVLQFSRVIDTKALPKDKVSLLSTVEFTNLVSEVKMKYTIVSPHEMDLSAGKISLNSPIAGSASGVMNILSVPVRQSFQPRFPCPRLTALATADTASSCPITLL